jgi:hypothetical protein
MVVSPPPYESQTLVFYLLLHESNIENRHEKFNNLNKKFKVAWK